MSYYSKILGKEVENLKSELEHGKHAGLYWRHLFNYAGSYQGCLRLLERRVRYFWKE